MTLFAVRIHDRMTEDDPNVATVMYSSGDASGPWFDMATGHPEHIEEIVGALEWREDVLQAERDREAARLQAERLGVLPDLATWKIDDVHARLRGQDITYRLRHAAWTAEEGSDTEHLNLAADQIVRLRQRVAELIDRLHDANEDALRLRARADELARANEHLARQVATRG